MRNAFFHKIPLQKPYETKPFLDLALTSFSWRPVQEPAGRPRLCSRAGQARLPLQRAVSYRGSFFPYLADFRCRARARARPGQASLAGLGRPDLAPFTKRCFLQGIVFPYLADFQCPARAARPGQPGWAGPASPARPGSLCKGWFPTGARFPVLSRFSMPRPPARAWPG